MDKCQACETPGDPFHCGLPGVLARIEDGKAAGSVERCDACQRYETDTDARKALDSRLAATSRNAPNEPPPGMYLELFHGRRDPDEALDDWGQDGPIFHCPEYVHTTYASDLKLGEIRGRPAELVITSKNQVFYGGWWYGDWSVFLPDASRRAEPSFLARLAEFDPVLARPPKIPAAG
jgi:hypothetical protein